MSDRSFSKDSWHYRLATVYQFDVFSTPKEDICGYVRQVIYGMFTASMISIVSAFFIWCLIQPWLYFFVDGWYKPSGNNSMALAIGMTLYIMAFVIACILLYVGKIKVYLKEHTNWYNKEQKPSFIKQAYSSWKDKTCYKITFYDPTQGGTDGPSDEYVYEDGYDHDEDEDEEPTKDELDLDIIKRYDN